MEDEEVQNEPDFSEVLEKLRRYLYSYYRPALTPREADMHLSTSEIWKQLLTILPNELILTKAIVAKWLHDGGFHFYDFGEMRFEWLLKKKETI